MLSRPILGRRVKQHSLQAARAQPSTSQQQVSDTPRGMGLLVEDEFLCPKSGYSIDMRVQDKCRDLGAIEFDESSHFLACTAPTGVNLIKRRHLKMLGYILVSVPSWEWDGLLGTERRRKYLQGKLHCKVGVDSAAHSRHAPDRLHASTQAGGASEFVARSQSNGLGLIKPDAEKAKIDGQPEHKRRSHQRGSNSFEAVAGIGSSAFRKEHTHQLRRRSQLRREADESQPRCSWLLLFFVLLLLYTVDLCTFMVHN
jgi:hypothetical protein